jgi:hypothetical protein
MAYKLGTQTGSLVNYVHGNSKQISPEVGMGVTILSWSDRHPGTIVKVYPDGSFDVQEDNYKRIDDNGMSETQEYEYTPNPEAYVRHFGPVKRGKDKGAIRENCKKGGQAIRIGRRERYYDFSF